MKLFNTTLEDTSSDDDDFGPALPSSAPKKKRRKLPYEKLYIAALPSANRYFKSLMHRDQLCFNTFTPFTDFLITSSVDGVVKFWKKDFGGVEFVKEFKAHDGEIRSVSVSADGRSFATAGGDKTVKIFDVQTFDLLAMLNLDYAPKAVCWVHGRGASIPLLAVSSEENSWIRIYDGRGENQEPLHTLKNVHKTPVALIAYNNEYDCVVSIDQGGMVEYWRPNGSYEKPDGVFSMKSATNLFEFKKVCCTLKSHSRKLTFISLNVSLLLSQFRQLESNLLLFHSQIVRSESSTSHPGSCTELMMNQSKRLPTCSKVAAPSKNSRTWSSVED